MIVAFILSMPGRASWNGRWSGEERCFCIIKRCTTKKSQEHMRKLLEVGSFGYSWNDGWRACVTLKEVDAKEARSLKKRSNGFSGYDWMVNSIMSHGEIKV
jgi:hypothetical protein